MFMVWHLFGFYSPTFFFPLLGSVVQSCTGHFLYFCFCIFLFFIAWYFSFFVLCALIQVFDSFFLHVSIDSFFLSGAGPLSISCGIPWGPGS